MVDKTTDFLPAGGRPTASMMLSAVIVNKHFRKK
jgi:hypothetical protein